MHSLTDLTHSRKPSGTQWTRLAEWLEDSKELLDLYKNELDRLSWPRADGRESHDLAMLELDAREEINFEMFSGILKSIPLPGSNTPETISSNTNAMDTKSPSVSSISEKELENYDSDGSGISGLSELRSPQATHLRDNSDIIASDHCARRVSPQLPRTVTPALESSPSGARKSNRRSMLLFRLQCVLTDCMRTGRLGHCSQSSGGDELAHWTLSSYEDDYDLEMQHDGHRLSSRSRESCMPTEWRASRTKLDSVAVDSSKEFSRRTNTARSAALAGS